VLVSTDNTEINQHLECGDGRWCFAYDEFFGQTHLHNNPKRQSIRGFGIVLAFSVAVYINLVCGRYPMEVIELFG